MKTERLLRKASQTLAIFAGTGVMAAGLLSLPAMAQTSYTVSDTQLQADVLTTLHNDAKLRGDTIATSAAQGVVTLTGSVANESAREEAENVAAGVSGVRSIQDNLTVAGQAGSGTAIAMGQSGGSAGSMPPPPPDANSEATAPASTGAAAGSMPPPPPDEGAEANNGGQQQYTPFPNGSAPQQQAGPAQTQAQNGGYGQPYPNQGNGYPNQGNVYPNQGSNQALIQGYPGQGYPQENGGYGPRGNAHPPQPVLGVSPRQQDGSGPVTIPAGTLLSVRTSQPLSTGTLKGGEFFQVTAAADVYENGVVAIPRGAVLNGQVLEAKNAGPFGGSPTLDLKLTSIQLGPTTYPVVADVWSSKGPSKTGYTATNAAGGAVFGALIGAIAGGGLGAGVGAIAGGTGGALISGATHGPRLDLPPEALLQFHLAQPLSVQPVKYGEAERLAASVPEPVLRQRPQYAVAPYPAPYAQPYPQPYPQPYMVRPYPY
jgi:hypothetical protein